MKFASGARELSSVLVVLVSMIACAAPATVDAQYSHTWSRLIGGTGNSQVYGTAIDPTDDAVYVVGSFKGEVRLDALTFLSTFNTNRTNDMFLAKFDSSGAVLWAKTYGGMGQDSGLAVLLGLGRKSLCHRHDRARHGRPTGRSRHR